MRFVLLIRVTTIKNEKTKEIVRKSMANLA
jgi:hypothetical protein